MTRNKKVSNVRQQIAWGLVQLALSALFDVVIYVCNDSFGGEFLIMAERLWILAAFALFLPASAVYGIITAIYRTNKKPAFTVVSILWNIIAGILILIVYRYLIVWVIDSVTVPELILLSIPFIGYSTLLIGDSLRVLWKLTIKRQVAGLLPGLPAAGLVFLFLFGAFSVTIVFWNPQWAAGVEHNELFAAGMQPGRGYRIPSLLVINDNSGREIVLAFAESRADAMLDWGDIDLVMRRSTDSGHTWSSIRVLVDAGNRTAGNPCPVFDQQTRTVWLPYCVDNKLVYIMYSKDFGLTWSKPVEITTQLKLSLKCKDTPLCMEYGTGPGIGIQLKSGRLVIPAYYMGPSTLRGAHIIFSDDHGITWEKGADLGAGEEPQVIETIDGIIYANCRYKRGQNRYIGLSKDGGQTWFSAYQQKDLPEAETQASILRFTSIAAAQKNRVLFTNPNYFSRGHLTLRMSYDEGQSWPVARELYSGPSCYSQIAVLKDHAIFILFEAGKYDYREGIYLAKVNLDWLTLGKDSLPDR
jgi:sialidase-1